MAEKEEEYSASNIQVLEGLEAVRKRPAMYIGDISEKGLHHLVYEVVDNSIDEALAGYADHIDVTINEDNSITVVDNGRGIPVDMHEKEHKSALEVVLTVLHAGGKFDKGSYKVSGGLHGVGVSCVNALSTYLRAEVHRNGKSYVQEYSCGKPTTELMITGDSTHTGTSITFKPDGSIFTVTTYDYETLSNRLRDLAFLNAGITLTLTDMRDKDAEGKPRNNVFFSREGLMEFVKYIDSNKEPLIANVIHLNTERQGIPVEVALTYNTSFNENVYSYVNNINTIEGGTHRTGFLRGLSSTLKRYADDNKLFEKAKIESKDVTASEFTQGLTAVISVKVMEPQFEGQTKTKLGSRDMGPDGPTVAKFISDFLKKELDNFLHKNLETSEIILKKIQESERERKAMAGVTKLARERAKKVNLHNSKLRDCRVHLNDAKGDEDRKLASSIFLTEGDSASGSITKIRDVETQAVFSLRGKPLNSFGLTRKVVYENEEFNLLQAALNIEDGLDGLRYNKVIIATDADVDGMHIRLLLITFFLQFFPDLIKRNHVYILQTPLFRVRNKQKTYYCYTEEERLAAIQAVGKNPEITRFKGLGEISPDEFRNFIGKDMRLDPVTMKKEDLVKDMLEFYMGKNTMERQNFIIDNLVVEEDVVN